MREVSLMFVGLGRVGQSLLDHLKSYDAAAHGLRFSVDVTVRSQVFEFADGSRFQRKSPGWDEVFALATALRAERKDLVIIDASDAETGPLHLKLVKDGFTVVTANKKPLVGTYDDYRKLTGAIDPRGHRSYWFEATVGGGLPLVRTVRELVETGDKIVSIEAVMSGTLNYLCEAHAEKRPFGDALLEACTLGLTEPDPRDDLLCRDIARKAVILGRLAGTSIEGITPPTPLLDEADVDKGLEAFLSALKRRRRWPRAWFEAGTACEYVFRMYPETLTTSAELVRRDKNRPALSGPENRFVIYTSRNGAVPIVISGPGAGAAITATAVFGDLLRSLARL